MNDSLNGFTARTLAAVSGVAALSICESLLIALNDLQIIKDRDAHNVLVDAAETHRSAAPKSENPGMHIAAANLIDLIMRGENSVRKI
jgi:hypothetical protein